MFEEGFKRAIENATPEQMAELETLTKRRRAVLSNDQLRDELCALDFMKPFEDIIKTITTCDGGMLFAFHGAQYHVHLHQRNYYGDEENGARVSKCESAKCDTFSHRRGTTTATAEGITIARGDFPEPEHLAEFVALLDAFVWDSVYAIHKQHASFYFRHHHRTHAPWE